MSADAAFPGRRPVAARTRPATGHRAPAVRLTLLALLVAAAGCAPRGAAGSGGPPAGTDTTARGARSGASVGAGASGRLAPTVILVSLDGFRYDLFSRAPTPNLDRIAAEGVKARWMVPTFPTKTFPNHYTEVTGLYPEHHGIVGNTMYDPVFDAWFHLGDRDAVTNPRWWGGEPIWVTAEEQGQHAGTVFWPGSEAPIDGVRPSRWLRYDSRMSFRARVDTVLSWLQLPRAQRPTFLTLYFDQPDHAEHEDGPDSPGAAAAVARVDTTVGWLLDGLSARGLLDQVNIIVTSDHGFAPTSPDRVVYLDDYVDLAPLRVVTWGPVAEIGAQDGSPTVVQRALAKLRGADPHMRVYAKADVPARLHFSHNRRIPPVVAIADVGWMIESHAGMRRMGRHFLRGNHGWDNAAPEMRAIFLARGPAFRKGDTVPAFANVHLYDLMCRVLGLRPATNDGSLDSVRAVLADSVAG